MLFSIRRLEPFGEFLGAFAGIARGVTGGNILAVDDAGTGNDVLPGGERLARAVVRHFVQDMHAAIDAGFIPRMTPVSSQSRMFQRFICAVILGRWQVQDLSAVAG